MSDQLLATVRGFHDTAQVWHRCAPVVPDAGGAAAKAVYLHALNFQLWHQEDAARRPGSADRDVAHHKRTIDELNARRNQAIEELDLALLTLIRVHPDAPLHTETPGTVVDRLSVLTLRILHTDRTTTRLRVLHQQSDDLLDGLARLLAGLRDGTVGFKVYRQFKSAADRDHCALP